LMRPYSPSLTQAPLLECAFSTFLRLMSET
jgi:hypothetical protein